MIFNTSKENSKKIRFPDGIWTHDPNFDISFELFKQFLL